MKLRIAIESKQYEVEVEVLEEDVVPAPRYASSPPPTGGSTAPPPSPRGGGASGASGDKACKSPIAGVVVRVLAEVGKAVKLNDPLVVLEAMKMESSITSPVDGTVARVNVGPGDGVKVGQVLIEID